MAEVTRRRTILNPLAQAGTFRYTVSGATREVNLLTLAAANGRLMKKDVLVHVVMEKRTGWGAEYPDSLRNGEWEYQAFNALGDSSPKTNLKACFECHKPLEKLDYVMTLPQLAGKLPGAGVVVNAKPSQGNVNIVGFAFSPVKIAAAVGKPLRFVNADDLPHSIAVQGAPQKTGVLLRGQSASVTFEQAGIYNYICGLHPTMKGTIEVR